MSTAVCGRWTPDPDVPADHRGRHYCAFCHLPGELGDARHPLPDVPEQAVSRSWAGDVETEGESG